MYETKRDKSMIRREVPLSFQILNDLEWENFRQGFYRRGNENWDCGRICRDHGILIGIKEK